MNTQFGCFSLDGGVGERGCGAGLLASIGERCGCSQWARVRCGYGSGTAFASASGRFSARARRAHRCVQRVQGERSERAHAAPLAIGRAEQRSGARIRVGACLSVASLRPTPRAASSARYPVGARPLARLFFGYFLLAKQKKVTRPAGRNLPRNPCLSFAYFSLAKQRKVRPAAGQIYAQKIPFLCPLSFDKAKESNSAYRPKPVFQTSASSPKPAFEPTLSRQNLQSHPDPAPP